MRQPGDWIHGKYQVESVLGSGGMGTVYATRRRNESRAAVKVLHEKFARDKNIRARFVEEGHLANRVGHPAVVTILEDDIDEQGNFYLVMELLDGVDLSAFITAPHRRKMTVAQALNVAEQLLAALSLAHQKGIIHQDIKPANVMVLRDGRVKLLDFGIAKTLFPDGAFFDEEEEGVVLGTDRFMSPEQGQGMFDAVDARTDIWAVGALLLELLSDQDASEVPLWDQSYEDRAWSFSRLGSDVPPRVTQIISKALQSRKSNRFASAQEMRLAVCEVHEQLYGPVSSHGLSLLHGGDEPVSSGSVFSDRSSAVPLADPTVISRPSHPPAAPVTLATPVTPRETAPTEPQPRRGVAHDSSNESARRLWLAAVVSATVLVALLLISKGAGTWSSEEPEGVGSQLRPSSSADTPSGGSGVPSHQLVATTDASQTEPAADEATSHQDAVGSKQREQKSPKKGSPPRVREAQSSKWTAPVAPPAAEPSAAEPSAAEPSGAEPSAQTAAPTRRCVNESGQVDIFDGRVCPP